jgi:hypothetical protein
MANDAIAPYAYNMLERAMGANDAGEVPGIGSEWNCEDFGKPGHNYTICKTCLNNFNAWWERDGRKRGTHANR